MSRLPESNSLLSDAGLGNGGGRACCTVRGVIRTLTTQKSVLWTSGGATEKPEQKTRNLLL